jgi:hypothetical protein
MLQPRKHASHNAASAAHSAQETTMYDTLEARFATSARRCTARGIRTSKLQLAFDALEFANGNVGEAKRIIAQRDLRISARTWAKAIGARILCSPTPVL